MKPCLSSLVSANCEYYGGRNEQLPYVLFRVFEANPPRRMGQSVRLTDTVGCIDRNTNKKCPSLCLCMKPDFEILVK